jgi:2-iminobutanoate/2-iminopropanoate deaminase
VTSNRAVIDATGAPAAVGPYSQAVRTGDLLFCSMQIALDRESGEIVGDTQAEQARGCMRGLAAIAEAAGTSLANSVRLTVYVTDIGGFKEVNEAYGEFFDEAPPARAAMEVAALPRGALVAIDAVIALAD